MKTMKYALAPLSLSICLSIGVNASADQVQDALEAQLKAVAAAPTSTTKVPLQTTVDALTQLQDKVPKAAGCDEHQRTTFGGGAYVLTADTNGQMCRIYDLSFPTVQTFLGGKRVSQIPLSTYTVQDFWDWTTGNVDAVLARHQNDPATSTPQNSWASQISFHQEGGSVLQSLNAGVTQDLPASFHASDLEVGNFALSPEDRARVLKIGTQMRDLVPNSQKSAQMEFWRTLADNPKSFLAKIRFDKNDAKKVYDVFLEGSFLPLKGPVALVDFENPYKPAVEGMIRNAVSSILINLSYSIPDPTVQKLVLLAITDSFDFLNQMYDYQNSQFEAALRSASVEHAATGMTSEISERSLNLLFGAQGNFLQQMILGAAQGKQIAWTDVERIGRTTRYDVEKVRSVRRATTNSRLVLKNSCQMTLVGDSFGICSKAGHMDAMYSLVSDFTVLNQDLGAPMIYRYSQPYQVSLIRGGSLLLSAAARIAPVPIPAFLMRTLSDQLKTFAMAGVVDEARLRQSLVAQKRSGKMLEPNSVSMLKALYVQNINPLLPKSEEAENAVIRANAGLLK